MNTALACISSHETLCAMAWLYFISFFFCSVDLIIKYENLVKVEVLRGEGVTIKSPSDSIVCSMLNVTLQRHILKSRFHI